MQTAISHLHTRRTLARSAAAVQNHARGLHRSGGGGGGGGSGGGGGGGGGAAAARPCVVAQIAHTQTEDAGVS